MKTLNEFGAALRSEVMKVSSASSAPYISVPIGAAIMWAAERIAQAIERRDAKEGT